MRIAVISDIHGNCFALDAALADLRSSPIDQIVCLGDAIQGGTQPAETVQRLRELACPIVMGNADAWLLAEENDTAEETSEQQREVRLWTLSKLSPDDLAFIRSFQPTVEVALEGAGARAINGSETGRTRRQPASDQRERECGNPVPARAAPRRGGQAPAAAGEQRLLCFHGSPTSYDDILLPDTPKEDWQRLLGPFAPAIMTGGHTHTQQMRRVGEGLFFNPGSIGVAYNYHLPEDQFHTDAWAEYAILTCEQGRLSLDFHRAPYDVEQLIQTIRSSGRPHAERMIAEYQRGNQ